MVKWWRRMKREEPESRSSEAPPTTESEISLPDLQEAREALAESRVNKKRTEELGKEVHEMLAFMRQAREDNHFAEGLIEMIQRGR
jgi:hypothetical protein